jgi:hypothetical protein
MVLCDRHCELGNGLPSVLDQCRCFLREEHKSSWRHHASSELCGRCASDDSHFGVCLRSQGFNKNDQDLGGGALATTQHQTVSFNAWRVAVHYVEDMEKATLAEFDREEAEWRETAERQVSNLCEIEDPLPRRRN